jgi:exopolysaccharide biosynthesis polyprenyl glycosylphosphotransferase
MTPQTSTLQSHGRDDNGSRLELAEAGRLIALPLRREPTTITVERTHPRLVRRETRRRRLLGAADVIAAGLALLPLLGFGDGHVSGLGVIAALPAVIVLFKLAGLYDREQMRLVHSTLDEVPALIQVTGLYALSVAILAPVLVGHGLAGDQIATLWLGSFVASAGGRSIARWIAGRSSGMERCLVVGEPHLADRVREKLVTSGARAEVIAVVPLSGGGLDYLGSPESVRHIANELLIDRVIIAPTTSDAQGVAELIRVAKAAGVRVSMLPRILEVVGSAVEFDDVDGLTLLGMRPFGLPRSSRAIKRAFDIVATAIGLVAVSPIVVAVAVAIRLDSKGPILFRQVRVGRDGQYFRIFKFRSMVIDAEQRKDDVRALNEVGDGTAGMFKLSSDPRVTRIGRFLRKTSLDELPQLFNVLRGEMSLVGPRPLVTEEDVQVRGLDRSRLYLTPGMTGPWQVLGARVPMHEMVGIDYLYVANWTLWLDLKLLLRTVRHVVRSGNV